MLESIVCRYSHFLEPWYKTQLSNLKIREIYRGHSAEQFDFVTRKFWEWCAIAQALEERSMLRADKEGLGFAVGTEPLPSFFASKGCRVVATDLATEESNPEWAKKKEHASSQKMLYYPTLIDRTLFNERVVFQPVDMRTLTGITGKYDFLWSSCALEHLGTLAAGIDFIVRSCEFLKLNGVAIHTTEFNVSSDTKTVEYGNNVIYRKKDLLYLKEKLSDNGFHLACFDFDAGSHPFDLDIDLPPYFESGKRHIKLEIEGHVCTSILLVIQKRSDHHNKKPGFLERLFRRSVSAFP